MSVGGGLLRGAAARTGDQIWGVMCGCRRRGAVLIVSVWFEVGRVGVETMTSSRLQSDLLEVFGRSWSAKDATLCLRVPLDVAGQFATVRRGSSVLEVWAVTGDGRRVPGQSTTEAQDTQGSARFRRLQQRALSCRSACKVRLGDTARDAFHADKRI